MGPLLADVPDVDGIVYPSSDGKPMAESSKQYGWIVMLSENIARLHADDPNVFVGADNFVYPVRGKPGIVIAPDVYVAFGRPAGHRSSYRVWNEGDLFPQVVMEVKSPSNTPKDLAETFEFYRTYGALEYTLVDPERETVEIWNREGDRLEPTPEPYGFVSPRLGIRFLRDDEDRLYVLGPDGRRFITLTQSDELYRTERKKAEAERKKAEAQRKKADTERQRAETERQRADAEAIARAKMAAKLRELGIDPDAI